MCQEDEVDVRDGVNTYLVSVLHELFKKLVHFLRNVLNPL